MTLDDLFENKEFKELFIEALTDCIQLATITSIPQKIQLEFNSFNIKIWVWNCITCGDTLLCLDDTPTFPFCSQCRTKNPPLEGIKRVNDPILTTIDKFKLKKIGTEDD